MTMLAGNFARQGFSLDNTIVNRAVKIFNTLEKVADFSDHPQHNLASAIVLRNKFVSFGYNRLKTDPFQARFGKNIDAIFLHAEIHAIKNALRRIDLEDFRRSDLYVMRVMTGERKWGMAKPCSGCMRAIAEFGIRNVFYINHEGKIDQL